MNLERFEHHTTSFINGNLGTFKEWYILLNDCNKDEFIVYVSNTESLTSDEKIRIYRFLLRSLI